MTLLQNPSSVCYISLIQSALTRRALLNSHSVVNPITFADDVLRRMTSLTVLESEMNLSVERPAAVPLKASACFHITADELEKQNTQKQKRENISQIVVLQGLKVARWREHSGRRGGGTALTIRSLYRLSCLMSGTFFYSRLHG